MAVYWSVAIITVLINLFPSKNEKQYSRRLIVSMIPLFIYGAFRVDFGLDYESYTEFFEGVKIYGHDSNERIEIGYYYLNRLLPSFRSLLVLQTLLICIAYYYLFKWYVPAKYGWMGFVLLFLSGPFTIFFMFSGIRNSIAISILILSTHFIHERKIIHFAGLIFIAYFFHNSVIFMAPIAYLVANNKQITLKWIVVWALVMMFLFVASSTIVLNYIDLFIANYFDRYITYVEQAKYLQKGAGLLSSSFTILLSILLMLFFKNKRLSNKQSMIVKLSLLFLISHVLGPLNIRMSQYFVSFFIVGSIIVMYWNINKFLKIAYFIAIFAYLIYSLIIWFNNPFFAYNTYKSILF